jgi:hypothetical protein
VMTRQTEWRAGTRGAAKMRDGVGLIRHDRRQQFKANHPLKIRP